MINKGSTIEATGSIYHGDRLVASPTKPFDGSFVNESLPQSHITTATGFTTSGGFYSSTFYGGPPITYPLPSVPATVIAGKSFVVSNGNTLTSGIINGQTIDIHTRRFHAENTDRTRVDRDMPQDSHLFLDLVEFGRSVYRNGFIHTTPEGRIKTKYPVVSGRHLTADDILVLQHESVAPASPLMMNPSLSFMIDTSVLPFVFQRAMTEYLGTQDINGASGNELLERCLEESRRLKQQTQSGVITYEQARKHNYMMLAFQQLHHLGQQWLKPIVVAPTSTINPFTSLGDTSTSKTVKIHTTETHDHIGNRVSGTEGIEATSDGTFNRETPKYSRYLCYQRWLRV